MKLNFAKEEMRHIGQIFQPSADSYFFKFFQFSTMFCQHSYITSMPCLNNLIYIDPSLLRFTVTNLTGVPMVMSRSVGQRCRDWFDDRHSVSMKVAGRIGSERKIKTNCLV